MFLKSHLRKSKSWCSSRLPIRSQRQIEVLHDFHEVAAIPSLSGTQKENLNEPQVAERRSMVKFVIDELITTEKTYVRELRSIVEHYMRPFKAVENQEIIPVHLRERADIVFGNIPDLLTFHNDFVLSDFLAAADSVAEMCRCFINRRDCFLHLYHVYCQNKPMSEALRSGDHIDGFKFFVDCQKHAGHPLPLSAYLLKPIQRITKYQLLLKELLRHCTVESRGQVEEAISSMLDLLAQLNTAMHQLHISGFMGNLTQLGALRLQNECDVFAFKKKNRRLNKAQRRYMFLFDGGVLFCKRRTQPVIYAREYFEHKLCIPTSSMGFAETSKSSPSRFEIWDEAKSEAYVVEPHDETVKTRWIQHLYRIVGNHLTDGEGRHRVQRPQSWTSTVSSESNGSTRSSSDTTTSGESVVDPNGNQSFVHMHSPIITVGPSSNFSMDCSSQCQKPSDRDNNLPRCDSLKTRSMSCPDTSLIAITVSSPLNPIAESSSQNELLAAI